MKRSRRHGTSRLDEINRRIALQEAAFKIQLEGEITGEKPPSAAYQPVTRIEQIFPALKELASGQMVEMVTVIPTEVPKPGSQALPPDQAERPTVVNHLQEGPLK
ncbi:MAG: hypothetical protein M3Q36_03560 [bacterium]|nr:hypothetical protein [bacterium]